MSPSQLQTEIQQTRPFRSAAEEATLGLLRTADGVQRRLAATIEPAGITLQQYTVLRILRGSEPQRLPTLEIAERMIEQRPGITRLLDRLERKALIARERCPVDRRRVYCSISPSGLELLARLDAPVLATIDSGFRHLDSETLQRLISLLDTVREKPSDNDAVHPGDTP